MAVTSTTAHLPDALWRAVQLLASQDGDTNPMFTRTLKEYVTTSGKQSGRQRPGMYQRPVTALSMPA